MGLVAAAGVAILLPLPSSAWLLAGTVMLAFGALATFWAPAMAMLSDAAEHAGLDLALAFSISNLAWAAGHVLVQAWAARWLRPPQTPCPTARSPWPARSFVGLDQPQAPRGRTGGLGA